ncbi:MAG TPA: response regulator transcription factor [Flavobacteriales bacterium]|nr:response regulator transcription factor [Flavobacteriales bacterium]
MRTTNILIVEDEPKVALFLKQGLEENNFATEIAYTGTRGQEMALSKTYDLVILDLNLPEIHGYEVCKEIRKKDSQLPIIMLTAFGTTNDKINGFDFGADDYIVKPFEFRELLARIKALLKRIPKHQNENIILRIADLEMNTVTKTVKRNNKKVELTAKEYLLLEHLMVNTGKVISRNEIAEKIWEINFDTGTNVIDVYINFLRKKIDKGFNAKLIHTYIGMGYVLKELD